MSSASYPDTSFEFVFLFVFDQLACHQPVAFKNVIMIMELMVIINVKHHNFNHHHPVFYEDIMIIMTMTIFSPKLYVHSTSGFLRPKTMMIWDSHKNPSNQDFYNKSGFFTLG